jgi:hypothetical protein
VSGLTADFNSSSVLNAFSRHPATIPPTVAAGKFSRFSPFRDRRIELFPLDRHFCLINGRDPKIRIDFARNGERN